MERKAGQNLMIVSLVLLMSVSGRAQSVPAQDASRASELVQELGRFEAAVPGIARSDGSPDAREDRRRAVYAQLWTLGETAMPALTKGLTDRDVEVRRNAALFLFAAGGHRYDLARPRMDIRPYLPGLIAALGDSDARVREFAAQAVGAIGSEAAVAVPDLIRLVSYPDDGSRNTACLGLRRIGPAAKDALPALRKALSDPSSDVRHSAGLAIAGIETR